MSLIFIFRPGLLYNIKYFPPILIRPVAIFFFQAGLDKFYKPCSQCRVNRTIFPASDIGKFQCDTLRRADKTTMCWRNLQAAWYYRVVLVHINKKRKIPFALSCTEEDSAERKGKWNGGGMEEKGVVGTGAGTTRGQILAHNVLERRKCSKRRSGFELWHFLSRGVALWMAHPGPA